MGGCLTQKEVTLWALLELGVKNLGDLLKNSLRFVQIIQDNHEHHLV